MHEATLSSRTLIRPKSTKIDHALTLMPSQQQKSCDVNTLTLADFDTKYRRQDGRIEPSMTNAITQVSKRFFRIFKRFSGTTIVCPNQVQKMSLYPVACLVHQ